MRFCFCLCLVGCVSAGRPQSLSADLVDRARTGDLAAFLLLANVSLSDADEAALAKMNNLFALYVLAKRTQERRYDEAFITAFPEEDPLWSTRTGYVIGCCSPLQDYLAHLAKTDDAALNKLVALVPSADGSFAEDLVGSLREIYRLRPAAVLAALKAHSISPESVQPGGK
jgi:hypothetical protein